MGRILGFETQKEGTSEGTGGRQACYPVAEYPAMRQLLLMRHAKSSWDDVALPDRDRPLNARGRKAAATMRAAIQDLGLLPDMILVSPACRTMQTLEALDPWDETPLIEPTDSLYLADPTQILAALHGVPETVRSVMVLGHNPGLHDLALALTGPASGSAGRGTAEQALSEGFPTAALAEFTIAGAWWDLRDGGGRLVRFLTPKMLEAAG
jgi:phosphohistidine phosphatase